MASHGGGMLTWWWCGLVCVGLVKNGGGLPDLAITSGVTVESSGAFWSDWVLCVWICRP